MKATTRMELFNCNEFRSKSRLIHWCKQVVKDKIIEVDENKLPGGMKKSRQISLRIKSKGPGIERILVVTVDLVK